MVNPEPQVSAFVTAAQVKFLLLHDGRSDDSIRGFFRDVYDGYLRVRERTTSESGRLQGFYMRNRDRIQVLSYALMP